MSLEQTAAAPQKRTYEAPALAGRWLAGVLTVARHEGRLLIYSPLTLIFQVWFLLALAILVFLVGEFYATDLATFDLQWTFLPWVALIMVPALAMRAFAEGPGDRGLELTFSLPLPISAIVIGKWLAGTAVLLTTLCLTVPFVLTVGYLGEPDWGAALSGYLGAALLLASFYATALLASASTRDYVTAFVTGLGALMILILLGWDAVAKVLEGSASAPIVSSFVSLSPKYWFDRFAEGRIELAGLIYFLLIITLTLGLAAWLLATRLTSHTGKPWAWGSLLLWAGAVLLLVLLATRLPFFLDLTDEREFTLHRETIAVAEQAPDRGVIDVYYSQNDAAIPARIRQHAKRVRNLLQQIVSRSGGRLTMTEHRTVEYGEAAESAVAAGVRRVPMTSGESFLLGAVFRHGERLGVIPYFDEERAEFLEYDLALAIASLGRKKTPRIGVLTPLLRARNAKEPRPGFAILEDLKRHYDVAVIPQFADVLPDDLDALVVIDAPILKRRMLYAIDQHLMRGRGLIVMVDPYPRLNPANRMLKLEPAAEINDISDLLLKYGARYKSDDVVGDASLAAPVSGADGRMMNYPFWLRVGKDNLSARHPVTASLNELLFAEAGSFEYGSNAANWEPLVETTRATATLPRSSFKKGNSEALAAAFDPKSGDGAALIAAAFSGPMESAFAEVDEEAGVNAGTTHLPRTDTANLFVVADADWLFDPLSSQVVELGDRAIARPLNDNATFLLNMTEFATGSPGLIGIRSRTTLRRPFTRVARILSASQDHYRAEEAQYIARITQVEERIAKVLEMTGAARVEQLPQELMQQVNDLRTKLIPFRRELKKIRRAMREEVERLGFRLTVFNLLGGPLLAILLSRMLHWRRRSASAFRSANIVGYL